MFLGITTLLLLLIWKRASLPARSLDDPEEGAPTLVTFVDSLATLYARTRDTSRVLERYRELSASQLKRALGLSIDTSNEKLVEHLRHIHGASEESIALLSGPAPRASAAELRKATRALDRMVKDAVG